MSVLIAVTLAAATLAFGGVYSWAFGPLFLVAGCMGLWGIRRRGIAREVRPLAASLLLLTIAIGLQLIPLPVKILHALSPKTVDFLGEYSLTFQSAASAPLSINPESTLLAFIAVAALSAYVIGAAGVLRRRMLTRLVGLIAIFAVPLALFGIVSHDYNNGLIYGFWKPQDGGGSAQVGPFVNHNHFGGWMLMAVPLVLGGVFGAIEDSSHDHVQRRQRWTHWWSSSTSAAIVLKTAAAAVMIASLVWTTSRSSWSAAVIGTVVYCALIASRKGIHRTIKKTLIVSLVVLAAIGVLWRGPQQIAAWYVHNDNLATRLDAWQDGWTVVRDFPLFGTGVNAYPTAMLLYQKRNPGFYVAQAHNDYLQLLAEGGLLVGVPALLAIAALVFAVKRNLHVHRDARGGYWLCAGAAVGLLSIACQEFFDFSLQLPANAFLFCTLAAVALKPPDPPESRTRVLRSDRSGLQSVITCPKCHSADLVRSRTRNRWEVWRKEITGKRPYHCRACDWRGWTVELGDIFSDAEVKEAEQAIAPKPPNLKRTTITREPFHPDVDLKKLDTFDE